MELLAWISLAVLILVVTTCLVFLFRGGLALWRDLKSLGSAVDATEREILSKLERLEASNDRLQATLPQLEVALTRLQASNARLTVLRAALQDVTDVWGRLAAVYPRK